MSAGTVAIGISRKEEEMNKSYQTEQERFWAGEFGDEYIERNRSANLLASNLHYFSRILAKKTNIASTFEVGCNVGMNTQALTLLLPEASHTAVEINNRAVEQCRVRNPNANIYHGSFLDFSVDEQFDLVFSKGVLIHLNPDVLSKVYDKLAKMSRRYVLIGEYYNPTPVSISYRGNEDKLFKRDFASEFLETNSEFRLVDYDFHYKGSENFSQDDITWFLMEK